MKKIFIILTLLLAGIAASGQQYTGKKVTAIDSLVADTIRARTQADVYAPSMQIENIKIDGNDISSTSGDITLTPTGEIYLNGAGVADSIAATRGYVDSASPTISSGTYTPTITGVTNITSASLSLTSAKYIRVGDVVTVSMILAIQATSAGRTFSEVGISLPVASTIAGEGDAVGNGTNITESAVGSVRGDAANNRAKFQFDAISTGTLGYEIMFQYEIL